MSRRKQSKPQHVEFADNKNDPLSNETLSHADTINQHLRPGPNDRKQTREVTTGLTDPLKSDAFPSEATMLATDEATPRLFANNIVRENTSEEETCIEDLDATSENCDHHTRMESPRSKEGAGDCQTFSAGFTARRCCQFVSSHRNLLHPKYNGSMTTTKRQDGELSNHHVQEEASKTRPAEEERCIYPVLPSGEGAEDIMYNCSSCDKHFECLEDFVQHKKVDCPNQSPGSGMALNEQNEREQQREREETSATSRDYVISGGVIMADDEDPAMEMDAAQGSSPDQRHDGTVAENPDTNRGSNEAPLEDDGDERVGTPDSVAESETTSENNEEYPCVRNTKSERPEPFEERQSSQPKETKDEAENPRKEIMAYSIQNMTALSSQTNGNHSEKPDISAIKYQVRLIQQQQAHQVQMLNFLQWQLALASSNPQAAVAAAASSRNNCVVNGLSMDRGMQPQFLAAADGPGGRNLMPQMMAAMAMNNFQNSSNENGMAELAKAKFLMGMQQASTENNQGIRNLVSSSMSEQEEVRRLDQQQRYQLKVATKEEDNTDIKMDDGKAKENQSQIELVRTKSDSGFDEGVRSSSANSATREDDTSSSRGSQEDEELRDNVLKSTAEEHRHKCHFCNKIFGSDSGLQIHIRSHTGERPFKCNICGNRFTTKGNLKVHFTRHKSKYPHIPMNSNPVPEYLDNVPTSSGVPYGMSILPEKAVLERPRLHGNPSIHPSPQQAAAMSQRDVASAQAFSHLFASQINGFGEKQDSDIFRPSRPDIGGMSPAHLASAIQAQLLQRRRVEYLKAHSQRPEEICDVPDAKNPMSILQAAMLPFLPGIAARHQFESVPSHLRYLLPHHLNALNVQGSVNGDNNNNKVDIRLPTLPRSAHPAAAGNLKQNLRASFSVGTVTSTHQGSSESSSETTKLQRLVENIDRSPVLQKNECYMCHRILSCQSALKLHYRTHTGERPYQCDLCSRAFTTRGNLRTHYTSVHRQQMPSLPPGGQSRSAQTQSFSCTLCSARFRDSVEFQHHMRMHSMAQAQQEQRLLEFEHEKNSISPTEVLDMSMSRGQEKPHDNEELRSCDIKRETESDGQKKVEKPAGEETHGAQREEVVARTTSSRPSNESAFVDEQEHSEDTVKREPSPANDDFAGSEVSRDSNDWSARTSPLANPLDSLAVLSNMATTSEMSQHTGSMLDHQLAALSRARAGRLTVCEICEKPFSCQSALEIHLRTHTKERPFLCQICQRAFTTKGNLKQHLLTHNITDITEQMLLPVSSPTSDNSASTTPSSSPTPNESQSLLGLKRPMNSSDASEPSTKRNFPRHWCRICRRQFSSASSLQIHNRTHTGEKPFACSVCGRAFTTKGNLKVHMGTHVWGAGGSRRGRRISMDNPLISPWMRNMTGPRSPQPAMTMPTSRHVTDPAALYQQYATLASGLLTAKQDARFMLPLTNSQNANPVPSPASSSGSPRPSNEMTSPHSRVNSADLTNPAVSATTEWFVNAYQRTQEQVN